MLLFVSGIRTTFSHIECALDTVLVAKTLAVVLFVVLNFVIVRLNLHDICTRDLREKKRKEKAKFSEY